MVDGTGRMVLDPLTEVVIGMLVPVGIGCRQLMVHILRDRKRGEDQQQQNQSER